MTEIVWALAIILPAAAGGVALSHVLEVPGKHSLDAAQVAVIQQRLYPGFRRFGMVVEPAGLVSVVGITVLLIGEGTAFGLACAASVTYLAMGIVFPLITQPMNRRIAQWDCANLPQGWGHTLRRWEFSHGLRASLMLLTSVLLVVAVVVDGP